MAQNPQQHRRRTDAASVSDMNEAELQALIVRCLDEREKAAAMNVSRAGWLKSNVGSLLTVIVLAGTIVATNSRMVERVDNLLDRFKEFKQETSSKLNSIDDRLNKVQNAK